MQEVFDEGKAQREKVVLEFVHYDLCGPIKITYISGARYFPLFVDEFSRRMCVFFLKRFGAFLEYSTRFQGSKKVFKVFLQQQDLFTSSLLQG